MIRSHSVGETAGRLSRSAEESQWFPPDSSQDACKEAPHAKVSTSVVEHIRSAGNRGRAFGTETVLSRESRASNFLTGARPKHFLVAVFVSVPVQSQGVSSYWKR